MVERHSIWSDSLKVREGELSAMALLERSLAVIDERNPELNAFVELDRTFAIEQAAAADRELRQGVCRGPLHGVPVGVKANIDVGDMIVSGCSAPLKNRVAVCDASSVKRLKEAGAVIVGITNMHELAYGALGTVSHYGPARNPHNPARISGGSSSGSAVAVGSGMVPLALGTDTGGSVRIPAAACGVVGLKPSYGRIDPGGLMPLCWTLDHVGILTNSVLDASLAAGVLLENYEVQQDLQELQGLAKGKAPDTDIRIGVCHLREIGMERSVAEVFFRGLDALRARGAKTSEFDLKHVPELHVSWANIVYAEAAAVYTKPHICDYRDFSPSVRVQIEAGRNISAEAYIDAQRLRASFQKYFLSLFVQYDVICLPTLPVIAPYIGQHRVDIDGHSFTSQDAMTFTNQLGNMLGFPVITIPAGLNEDRMPVGMSLIMPYGQDRKLLRMAAAFESIMA